MHPQRYYIRTCLIPKLSLIRGIFTQQTFHDTHVPVTNQNVPTTWKEIFTSNLHFHESKDGRTWKIYTIYTYLTGVRPLMFFKPPFLIKTLPTFLTSFLLIFNIRHVWFICLRDKSLGSRAFVLRVSHLSAPRRWKTLGTSFDTVKPPPSIVFFSHSQPLKNICIANRNIGQFRLN